MKPQDIRFYPLPTNEFIVSYYDSLRRIRIQKSFLEEQKATLYFNELKSYRPIKEEKRSLKACNIEELLQVYFDEVPEASLNRSAQLIQDFLRQFALFKPEEIKEIQLRAFYQKQKLEYNYTNYSLSTTKYKVQGFFKWMVSRGILEDSPQSKIVFGKSKVYRRPQIWVKPSAIQKLLEGAKKHSPGFLYPIILLINETALRTNEIVNLKWNQIDFKNKIVSLPEGENIRLRKLDLTDELVSAIKRIDQISQYVFTTLEGRQLRKEILVRELKILKRKIDLEDTKWVFRDLRFSYAVNFLKAGKDIKDLQVILGHKHLLMTKELYGHYQVGSAEFLDIHEVVPGTEVDSSESYKFEEFE